MLSAHAWAVVGLVLLPLLVWVPLWLCDVDREPDNAITQEQPDVPAPQVTATCGYTRETARLLATSAVKPGDGRGSLSLGNAPLSQCRTAGRFLRRMPS